MPWRNSKDVKGTLKNFSKIISVPTFPVLSLLSAFLFHEVCARSCFVCIQDLLHPYASFLLRVSHKFHGSESLNSSLFGVTTLFQSESIKNGQEQSLFPNYE